MDNEPVLIETKSGGRMIPLDLEYFINLLCSHSFDKSISTCFLDTDPQWAVLFKVRCCSFVNIRKLQGLGVLVHL